MPEGHRGQIARAWIAVLLWVAVIWTLSGEGFSAPTTSRFLVKFLKWLEPDITARQIWAAHVFVRKSAHAIEYALLAALAFRALRLSLDLSMPRHTALTLLVVLGVAGIDETRQSMLPSRTGALQDVTIDFFGGLLGVLLIIAIYRRLGVGPPVPKENG